MDLVNLPVSAASTSAATTEPAWRQRAVDRSTQSARLRAQNRVQRFLDAAQAIIVEKGSTEFTVQEVVERSKQSLRSFYQYFDGKHELLLALFEEELQRAAASIRGRGLEAVRPPRPPPRRRREALRHVAGRTDRTPADLLGLLDAAPHRPPRGGGCRLRADLRVRRRARGGCGGGRLGATGQGAPPRLLGHADRPVRGPGQHPSDPHGAPLTADEVWDFCLQGIAAEAPTGDRKRRRTR